ncbi:hypothetical protein K1719_019606 [Acacia pycnantha]|nr:hypothetical protein K1719_019606 [Acacia pycnantha]
MMPRGGACLVRMKAVMGHLARLGSSEAIIHSASSSTPDILLFRSSILIQHANFYFETFELTLKGLNSELLFPD